jgi:predicted nucleic acid-binding protein
MNPKPVVLDTAVILNLLATGIGEVILDCLHTECLVSTAAAQETLFIRADDHAEPVRHVSVEPWVSEKSVAIVAPEGPEEENLYIQFASELDDGEAMSLAICCSRNCTLATDDRKARRLAGSVRPEAVTVLSTAEILHRWADQTSPSKELLRETIRSIEIRARFVPLSGDPFREWWLSGR